MLDSAIELTGDVFTLLAETISNSDVGTTGQRGLLSEDMGQHHSDRVEPISTSYRGYDIYEFPPNSGFFSNASIPARLWEKRGSHSRFTCAHPSAAGIRRKADAKRTHLTKRNFYRFLDK